MIGSTLLQGRDRYERVVEGWVDNSHEDAFTHTVRVHDESFGVELSAVCTPSPGYEVREARARALTDRMDRAAASRLAELRGARMVAGFARRLTVLAGAGGALLVDAAIEIARLARQVAKLPRALTERASGGDPWECWQLDTTGWIDLPDSCFTYSQAGRALLEAREVTTPMVADLYSPPPGASRVFVRKRVLRLVRTGPRLHCFHSMHDNVHGFDIHYEIEVESGRIAAADSITSRLPYQGLCTEPQGKIASLRGETVDAGLRKRIQPLVGGPAGCAQLYDLTSDLLKLLTV